MKSVRRNGRWGDPFDCGPFSGERHGTTLRWLTTGDCECVRMIAMVVRDREWRTLAPVSVRQRVHADGRWRVVARTPVGRATLAWRFEVEPRVRGLDVRVDMTAHGDVVTNRSGLVVLLPTATFTGARFTALHGERNATRGRLPTVIAAHQPMVDLTGLRVAARGGPALAFDFEGDVFEMEDHRNWLDPTFKLYSRSLARPIPYRIRDGATVTQRVVVDLVDARPAPRRASRARTSRRGQVPALGVATAPSRVPDDEAVVVALREAAPQFVMHRTDAAARGIARANRLAAQIGAELRIEAFGDRTRPLDAIARARPAAVALHSASPAARDMLRERAPDTAQVGGTFADFVMLNRKGAVADAQRVTFALCPTVHARDDRSLIESLDGLPAVIDQARRIAGERPLDVGPASLRRRLVPRNGAPADKPVSKDGVPYDVDPRQGSPIAAAWLAGAIAIAGSRGVGSFAAFEASGARGLVGDREAFEVPRGMRPGRRGASHAVFAALAARPRARLVLHELDAFTGAAFAIAGERNELWLVELAGRARRVPELREGTMVLDDARRGARWAPLRRAHLLAFGILRAPVSQLDDDATRALARAWCRPESPAHRGKR